MFLSSLLPRYLAYLVCMELLKTRQIAYDGFPFWYCKPTSLFYKDCAKLVPDFCFQE